MVKTADPAGIGCLGAAIGRIAPDSFRPTSRDRSDGSSGSRASSRWIGSMPGPWGFSGPTFRADPSLPPGLVLMVDRDGREVGRIDLKV